MGRESSSRRVRFRCLPCLTGESLAQPALGYANTKDALARHCKGVVNHYPLETAGGIQQVRFISEGDLYRLIVSSKLPAAEQFEAWVFDEVFPSIRRHGVYAIDELLADDEFLERAIATLRAERAKRLAAEQALLEAAPKVSYYDVVLASPSLITTTEIAKDYGGRRRRRAGSTGRRDARSRRR